MKKTTTTEYFYNDRDSIDRVVTTETLDGCACDECDEGELLADEFEVTSESTEPLAVAALALATVGLCITAVSAIFNRK